MQDEHFMRQWNESHDAFSAGVTRLTAKFERDASGYRADDSVELRYAHANRIFVAIIAGLVAAVATASTITTIDAANTPRAMVAHAPLA